jgi:hypothetical protein
LTDFLHSKDQEITAKEHALTNRNNTHQLELANKDSAHKLELAAKDQEIAAKETALTNKENADKLELTNKDNLRSLSRLQRRRTLQQRIKSGSDRLHLL